jgi:hypothetical protein
VTVTKIVKGPVGTFSSDEVQIVNEPFTSKFDVYVKLRHLNLQATTSVVSTVGGGTTYTEGVDYVMDNPNGAIKVLSTGSMSDATGYEIDYHYDEPSLAWKINQITSTASVVRKVACTNSGKIGVAVIVYTP